MEDKVILGLNLHNIFTKTMIFLSKHVYPAYLSICNIYEPRGKGYQFFNKSSPILYN